MSFEVTDFRDRFREFADDEEFPDPVIEQWEATALLYVPDNSFDSDVIDYAQMLMTAHLLFVSVHQNFGNHLGVLKSAGQGKPTVTFADRVLNSNFQYWMSLSLYGTQLLGLRGQSSVGGFYAGGSPRMTLSGGY